MQTIHLEDALGYLTLTLSKLVDTVGKVASNMNRPYGSDIWIPDVCWEYWRGQGVNSRELASPNDDLAYRLFYDAAWELCRRGILRPGEVIPKGQSTAKGFNGDGYCLTSFGREWVKQAATRAIVPASPDRLTAVLIEHAPRFGKGFQQRAAEAVGCYTTNNYLACCAMSGAAAESILLATAIEKSGDEAKVLIEYRSASGRKKVIALIIGSVSKGIAEQFETGCGILSYWRDEASHGSESNIGEIEAHEALSRLLRLCQFTSANWEALTR